jgi:hypothetical protein
MASEKNEGQKKKFLVPRNRYNGKGLHYDFVLMNVRVWGGG